jgi:hypothetical protein
VAWNILQELYDVLHSSFIYFYRFPKHAGEHCVLAERGGKGAERRANRGEEEGKVLRERDERGGQVGREEERDEGFNTS